MKKFIGLALLMVMVTGCVAAPVTPVTFPVTPTTQTVSDYSITAQPPTTPVLTNEPPKNRTWLSPGKVDISNYYAGATAEWYIQVHNGKPVPTKFSVTYRYPDYTATGYDKPVSAAQDWVIISDATPVLAAYETRDILVTLNMPANVKNTPAKWEYWISVMDKSQTGNVATELCSRWLIVMR
jgi:hypothetical protein